jgi:pseudouridine kinase
MSGTAKKRAVVIGGMNIDIQGRSRLTFRAGDSNPGEVRFTPGGVGRNIAENLLRLDFTTSLISVVGDDEYGAALLRSAGEIGLDLSASLRLEGRPSPVYLCLLDEDGRLVGAVAAMDELDRLDPSYLRERFDVIDGADLLVIEANLSAQSLEILALRYGRGGELETRGLARPFLVFDTVSAAKAGRGKAILGFCDLMKPNLAEAALLAGVDLETCKEGDESPDLGRLARGFGEACGAAGREVFISLGSGGLYFEGKVGKELIRGIARAPAIPIVNVSGAGDAAVASLAWAAMGNSTLEERARLAVAAAALAASAAETVSPSMCAEEIRGIARGVICERLP